MNVHTNTDASQMTARAEEVGFIHTMSHHHSYYVTSSLLSNTDASQMKEGSEKVGFRVGTVDWLHLALKDHVTWMRETDVLAGMYGVGLIKVVFARPGSAILELIPYCFSNASDFWELSQALRLRHYVWRNPDPRLSACHVEHCRVHQCGYNPAPEDRRMAGGSADPLKQDTWVDLSVVHALLSDAFTFITRPLERALPSSREHLEPEAWPMATANSVFKRKGKIKPLLGHRDPTWRHYLEFKARLEQLPPFGSACAVEVEENREEEGRAAGNTGNTSNEATGLLRVECIHVV